MAAGPLRVRPAYCAQATPVMVSAAPASFSAVNCSSSSSQATTPEIGGIRYMSGALRATPRTALTHTHTSQPKKADTTAAQNMPNQAAAGTASSGAARNEGSVMRTSGGAPTASV